MPTIEDLTGGTQPFQCPFGDPAKPVYIKGKYRVETFNPVRAITSQRARNVQRQAELRLKKFTDARRAAYANLRSQAEQEVEAQRVKITTLVSQNFTEGMSDEDKVAAVDTAMAELVDAKLEDLVADAVPITEEELAAEMAVADAQEGLIRLAAEVLAGSLVSWDYQEEVTDPVDASKTKKEVVPLTVDRLMHVPFLVLNTLTNHLQEKQSPNQKTVSS
jgi:hypothetical protein